MDATEGLLASTASAMHPQSTTPGPPPIAPEWTQRLRKAARTSVELGPVVVAATVMLCASDPQRPQFVPESCVRRLVERCALDVVHPRAGFLGLAAGDVGDRGGAEGGAERLHALLPDAAGLLALLADHAVQRLDHLEDVDLTGRAGER